MPENLFIARWFIRGGGLLAAFGLLLWFFLPIHATIPPYLGTAALALAYGWYCRRRRPAVGAGKS